MEEYLHLSMLGEYSIELNNLILEKNKVIKKYKKRLKEI